MGLTRRRLSRWPPPCGRLRAGGTPGGGEAGSGETWGSLPRTPGRAHLPGPDPVPRLGARDPFQGLLGNRGGETGTARLWPRSFVQASGRPAPSPRMEASRATAGIFRWLLDRAGRLLPSPPALPVLVLLDTLCPSRPRSSSAWALGPLHPNSPSPPDLLSPPPLSAATRSTWSWRSAAPLMENTDPGFSASTCRCHLSSDSVPHVLRVP